MQETRTFMIAGLGNPGDKYSQTRHNIGFMAVDNLAKRNIQKFDKLRFNAEYTIFTYTGNKVFLVKPQSYMNNSGFPVQKLASYFKIDLTDIIIIHDDIDLPFGNLRVSKDRGHGGHNGIRSIIDAFGSKDFSRIRVGIANPERQNNVTGHVLGDFSKQESDLLDQFVKKAADASLSVVKNGVISSMNSYNSN